MIVDLVKLHIAEALNGVTENMVMRNTSMK